MQDIVANIAFFIAQECHAKEQWEKCLFWYKQVLRLEPDNPEVHYALSYIAAQDGYFKEAVEHCSRAMKSDLEDHAMIAQYNRALLRLMLKDYKGGFEDYEARLNFSINKSLRFEKFGNLPYWSGEPCKLLHVSGEQGFGDIFQFSRYVPLIKEKFQVEKIRFDVPQTLNSFFRHNYRNNPEIEVISDQQDMDADYQIQLISLAKVFGTSYETVPPIKLEADKEWRNIKSPQFKIGYVHSGRTAPNDMQVMEWHRRRSIDARLFAKIWEGLPVTAISLQPELNSSINDWSDTAALIDVCDLIIAVDSGPIHQAIAIGKPVWLLNHKMTCWRWELQGSKTAWYGDNLEILRQEVDGDWLPVIEAARNKLKSLLDVKIAA